MTTSTSVITATSRPPRAACTGGAIGWRGMIVAAEVDNAGWNGQVHVSYPGPVAHVRF